MLEYMAWRRQSHIGMRGGPIIELGSAAVI
jgi:hypothetical protein